jgi:hypothetical protein
VAYIGRNVYGASWQVADAGSYRMWANPFAALAVMDPVCPVVRSWTIVVRPAAPSWMSIVMSSPGFMNRSVVSSGVNEAPV